MSVCLHIVYYFCIGLASSFSMRISFQNFYPSCGWTGNPFITVQYCRSERAYAVRRLQFQVPVRRRRPARLGSHCCTYGRVNVIPRQAVSSDPSPAGGHAAAPLARAIHSSIAVAVPGPYPRFSSASAAVESKSLIASASRTTHFNPSDPALAIKFLQALGKIRRVGEHQRRVKAVDDQARLGQRRTPWSHYSAVHGSAARHPSSSNNRVMRVREM